VADAVSRAHHRPTLLLGEPGSGRTKTAVHLAEVLERPVFRISLPKFDDEALLRESLKQIRECGGIAILDDLDRLSGEAAPECLPAINEAWSNGPSTLTIVSHEGRARLEAWMPGALEMVDTLELRPLGTEHMRDAVYQAADELLDRHGLTRAGDSPLEGLIRVADQHLGGLAMPGRALDLLDLACARTLRQGSDQVHADTWIDIVCERTGLSRGRVDGSGDQDVLDLDTALARYVVGHSEPLHTIASLVRRNRAGFGGARPVASVLLLGPSGVGKTEIAKALASSLFHREDALVRLDMSEYAEAHAVARVVGAPPGYVGHEQGGALTDPLLAQPHRVVLLDEIEKAHRDVHQLMLQVFDEGRLTDGRGRTVDFRHALIVMTSNLGAPLMEEDPHCDEQEVLDEARAAFPVELWNRIEAPLVLRPLTSAELHKVCKRLVASSSKRLLAERGVQYELSEGAAAHLVQLAGDDPSLGARPLRHLLSRQVEAFIADSILRGQLRAGTKVIVDHGIRGYSLRQTRR
jgi:ATP-dependent Clp protease ATP-binding subunit ClpC